MLLTFINEKDVTLVIFLKTKIPTCICGSFKQPCIANHMSKDINEQFSWCDRAIAITLIIM